MLTDVELQVEKVTLVCAVHDREVQQSRTCPAGIDKKGCN
jgi:hypothetical protein